MELEFASQPYQQREKALVLLFVVLLIGGLLVFLASDSILFRKEGYSRPSYRFSDLETTSVAGRPTHLLELGTVTPNDEVSIYVYSPAIVVRVEVIANGDTTLFNFERNGSVSMTIGQQPFYRASDITVKITEMCAPCEYTGWEYVHYSDDSVSPHFEVFVFSVGSYVTGVLLTIGNWFSVTGRLRVRRAWLTLVTIPVGLFFYGYYLWAFRDPNYIALALGALAAAIGVAGLLLAVERRTLQGSERVDPIAIAQRNVRSSLHGPLRFEGWTAQWSKDRSYADVSGIVIDRRLESHTVRMRVTSDREVILYVLE